MKYVEIYKDTNRVKFIHNMPFDENYGLKKSAEELLKTGYLLNDVPDEPDPQAYPGYCFELYYDPEKDEAKYVKKKIEKEPDEDSVEE